MQASCMYNGVCYKSNVFRSTHELQEVIQALESENFTDEAAIMYKSSLVSATVNLNFKLLSYRKASASIC